MASPAWSPSLRPRSSPPRSQTSPASFAGLLTPRFTSPGPIEAEYEHPPYKPNSDDEISLDMHHKKPRKIGKSTRRLQRSDQSDESKPLLDSSNLATAASRDSWFQRDNSVVDVGSKGFDCSRIRQDSVAQYQKRLANRQQLSQVEEDAPESESESEQESRVESLKFAKASSIHRKRGESLVGFTASPVASLVNAFCVSNDSYTSPEQSVLRTFSFEPTQQHRSRSWTEIHRPSSRKPPTLNRQDTPASITLRKASRASDEQRKPRSKSIANRVLDWFQGSENSRQSTNFAENRQVKFDLSIPVHDTLSVRQHKPPSVAVPQSAQSSLDLLNNNDDCAYSRPKRQSVTADLALTYAEMQPAHLAGSCSPSRQALVAMGAHRKPSRSRVRTGSSVHEIIWTKDDSPSSLASYNFDLTKSASLSPVTDRGSSGQGSLSVPTSSVQALRAVSPSKSATFPPDKRNEAASIHESLPQHGFSNWSWQPDTIRESLKVGRDQHPDSDSAGGANTQKALPHEEKVRMTGVISDLDTVESFPPLLNRKKTSDWQRLPLVDLNDPRAGREDMEPVDQQHEQSVVAADEAPTLILSVLEAVATQDFANQREPSLAQIVESPQKQEADSAAIKLAHARPSIPNRHPRRASSNVGISKASRISKHRRSISDGAVPDVAALLAQASRTVRNSMSAISREAGSSEPLRRASKVAPRRKSRSVQSLSLSSSEEVCHPMTTQNPSVRLVEVAGEDGGEGEDVGCWSTNASRNKSRLSLGLDWMP